MSDLRLRHHLAEDSFSLGLVIRELESGADPNAISQDDGVSAMHLAAGLGKEVTGCLIQYGGDPNIRSQERMTPLHVAASYGDLATLKLLLCNGANANLQDEDGNRPLDLAMENGHSLCVQELKVHTMLSRVEDCSGFAYSHQDRDGHGCIQGHQLSYLDHSCIDPEILENKYAKTITEELYDYLSEGKNICFDATSPTTPLVGLKNPCRKPCSGCNTDSSSCNIHKLSESLNHCGYIHSPHSFQSNHPQPSSPRLGRESSYTSLSSHRINNDTSANRSCSSPTLNHKSFSPSFTPPRMDYESQQRLSSGRCLYSNHSPQARNLGTTPYSAPHSITHESCCSPHSCQGINQQPPCQSHSHQEIKEESLYLSTSSQRINRGSTCQTHSPERINHGSPCRSYSPQGINQGSLYLSQSPQRINHRSPCRPHSPERINHRSPCRPHSPERINHRLPCQPQSPERINHRSPFRPHSPERINHRSPCRPHSPERINHRSPCRPHSPEIINHRSPCRPHSPKRMNQGSFHVSQSPQRGCHGNSNISSAEMIKYVKNNSLDSEVHDFHPPKNVHRYFPSYILSNYDVIHSFHSSVNDKPAPYHTTPSYCQEILQTKPDNENLSSASGKDESSHEYKSKSHVTEDCPVNKRFPSLSSSNQSVSSTLSRVAEYVLSCTDFASHCSVDDTSKLKPNLSSHRISSESSGLGKENLSPNESPSKNNLSSSSNDSFCTAENDSSSTSPEVLVRDKCLKSSHLPQNSTSLSQNSALKGDIFGGERDSSQRWHPPTVLHRNLLDDSIMTSENSFTVPDKINLSRPKFTNVNNELQKKRKELGYSSFPRIYNYNSKENEALCLDNSLFSTMTFEEVLHTDPESGITLVEKWIPSECGSSIVSSRRSLESLNSKLSQDSQATLIYDWKTLKQVSKSDSCNDSTQTISFPNDNGRVNEDDTTEDTVIPLRFKKLSNEELSQELQKYGEIPGPVIAATRQVYLKRLASLEADPGLVKITKKCPDYPNELRQVMNGSSLDWSNVSELEMKMVDNFQSSQGRQWREGCVKSSFTYLLLDPRVTSNLPLRAKDLSELETFKNFICGIFYIGKGKRARPYCHLYEAASKMDKRNSKISDKLQHIIDIWKSNLGVISLHCFQSVIPVEAYTREACMLEAIGMHKVTNVKRGDFYGVVSTWPMHQRRNLGTYLLHKAMKIFLAEGERQICPLDLKSGSQ